LSIRFAAKSALAICITVACSGAVALLPRVADAKPPAASKGAKQPIGVGAVTGSQGAKIRTKLLKLLRASGSYEVTDVEDVRPGASPQTIQNMAQGTGSEAIIVGNVSKAVNLTLSVYGANGARIDSITVKGGTFPKLFKAVDNEVEIAIADPLARARSGGGQPKAAAQPPAPKPKPKLAPGEAEDEEEVELEEPAKPKKGKGKPAPTPKATDKAKPGKGGDELESEDVDTTTGEPIEGAGDEEDEGGEPEAPTEPSKPGLRPLELQAGLRGVIRKFAYTGRTTPGLIPYNGALVPTIVLAGRFYPGALSSDGALSNIGLVGRFELGLGGTTNYTEGGANGTPKVVVPLKTNAYEYQLGVRGRLPLGLNELGVSAVVGNQTFTIGGDENPLKVPYAVVPDVHYHYIRVGLDARLYISKLIVGAQLAPRFLTSMKELDKGRVWFPGAKGSGLDFGVMLAWRFLPWLAPAAGLDLVRYGFDFNNLPTSPAPRVVAGGATDTFLSGWLGVVANFDFAGGASAGGASVSATPDADDTSDKSDDEASDKSDDEASDKSDDEGDEEAAPAPKPKPSAKKPAKKPLPDDEEEEEEPDE
jgi:hypothetical protein